ncbi:MAG: thioredoxin fold domain-containing protein [Dehalococcoidia bacterium]
MLGWGLGGALLIALAVLLIRGPGGQSTEDLTILALAEEASGGPVRVLTGPAHTVYHSTLPLPSAEMPREDGRPTLIWFSATTCLFCERMDPFVYTTISGFTDRLAFVEKSLPNDRGAASRYGIRGTPTFVLVDTTGNEIGRFFFQSSGTAFSDSILTALRLIEG